MDNTLDTKDAGPFHFLLLPCDIREKVYRFGTHDRPAGPSNEDTRKMSTGDTLAAEGPNPPKQAPLKSMNRPVEVTTRTTYRLQPYHFNQKIPLVSLVALDRLIRKEAVSILSHIQGQFLSTRSDCVSGSIHD